MKTATKRFYLFTERGVTDRFYCGNIYEALPDDEIKVHGSCMSFKTALELQFCKEFTTRKAANEYSRSQEGAMEDSNNYANNAMRDEELFGCEGVDNTLYDIY